MKITMCCPIKFPYPTHGRFFNLSSHPCRNSGLASSFPLKTMASTTPLPPSLGISVNLPWGGYGYFLELHNNNYGKNTDQLAHKGQTKKSVNKSALILYFFSHAIGAC